MSWLWVSLWCAGTYFSGATIYDAESGSLREDMFIWVDKNGVVRTVSDKPVPGLGEVERIDGAVVLPHWSDFYSLVQDRGLGVDQDLNEEIQGRMARYLKNLGFYSVRDPVFPKQALGNGFDNELGLLPMEGYVEVPTGPSRGFAVVLDPNRPLDEQASLVPAKGPVTLWWSSAGFDSPLVWPENPDFLKRLITFFHASNRAVGAYVQDATAKEMQQLLQFDIDFIEGLPADGMMLSADERPDLVWIPIAALNDKRYCIKYFEKRLSGLQRLGLFDTQLLGRAEDRIDQIAHQIRERCRIWKSRRNFVMEPLKRWLRDGGKVGLGSGGGHLFSFTGDIRSELDMLGDLGAMEETLLRAAFEHTPALLGNAAPYLREGEPAHFVVYREDGYWGRLVGTRVDLNFVLGKQLGAGTLVGFPQSVP